MTNVFLRPDLKTAGGEVSDILLNGEYIGCLSLVYREQHRISGAIQLDKPSMPFSKKDDVLRYIHEYMQAFASSIQAEVCTLNVSYGTLECYMDYYDYDGAYDDELDDDVAEANGDDIGYEELETLDMSYSNYRLEIISESPTLVEYHIYDQEHEWLAEAVIRTSEKAVWGDFYWMFEPTTEEMETISELLASDFDDEVMERFIFKHIYENELVDTIEYMEIVETQEMDYTVLLTRDEGEILTYEIYDESDGQFPVGTATVDIGHSVVTGFIEFHDPADTENMDNIAALLMLELDKEREYESINLTLLYQNMPINEISIECAPVH